MRWSETSAERTITSSMILKLFYARIKISVTQKANDGPLHVVKLIPKLKLEIAIVKIRN